MSRHDRNAARTRALKEKHPLEYCAERRCLWFTGGGKPCPKHPHAIHLDPAGADDARQPEEGADDDAAR